MTYIASHNGRRIGVSTHDFTEDHRRALLAIASGDHRLRSSDAYALEGFGLARVAHNNDYGATVLTSKGEAMAAYLLDSGDTWR